MLSAWENKHPRSVVRRIGRGGAGVYGCSISITDYLATFLLPFWMYTWPAGVSLMRRPLRS